MPSIIGDYDINTREDLTHHISTAIRGMDQLPDINDRFQRALLTFTFVDKYLDWFAGDTKFLLTVVDKLYSFRESLCEYEYRVYDQFSHLIPQIARIVDGH